MIRFFYETTSKFLLLYVLFFFTNNFFLTNYFSKGQYLLYKLQKGSIKNTLYYEYPLKNILNKPSIENGFNNQINMQ